MLPEDDGEDGPHSYGDVKVEGHHEVVPASLGSGLWWPHDGRDGSRGEENTKQEERDCLVRATIFNFKIWAQVIFMLYLLSQKKARKGGRAVAISALT